MTAVEEIKKAIVIGIMCDELPEMQSDDINQLAVWLASEGIGKTS